MTSSPEQTGSRPGAIFWILLVSMVAAAIFAVFQVFRTIEINDQLEQASKRHDLAVQWKIDTRLNLTRTMAISKSGNLQSLSDYLKPQMTETSARIAERQKFLQEAAKTDDAKALMSAVTEQRSAYIAMRDSIFAQMKAGDVPGASIRVRMGLVPTARGYMDAISAVEQSLLKEEQKANALQESNAWVMGGWIVAATAAVLVTLTQLFLVLRGRKI